VLRAITGYSLTVFGDGSNWRPFVHVKDVARAFLFFAFKGKSGEIYNIGCENYRISDVAEIVRREVNPAVSIVFDEKKKPEFSYHVRFEKAKLAGFETQYNLVEGIRDLANKIRDLRTFRG
jgi:nucleoside-diphosphate-sugar epimerase